MKQAAFVLLYTKPQAVYAGLTEVTDHVRTMTVPVCLLGVRPDGRFGFPGGGVNEGEKPRMAALRELREECGIVLQGRDLTKHGCFTSGDLEIWSYSAEVDPEVIRSGILGAHYASHGAEIPGWVAMPLTKYFKYSLQQDRWCGSALQEMQRLYDKLGL